MVFTRENTRETSERKRQNQIQSESQTESFTRLESFSNRCWEFFCVNRKKVESTTVSIIVEVHIYREDELRTSDKAWISIMLTTRALKRDHSNPNPEKCSRAMSNLFFIVSSFS